MSSQTEAWGNLVVGCYAYDQTGTLWRIDAEQAGWLRLTNRAGDQRSIRRPAPTHPVQIPVITEGQAIRTVHSILGGVVIAVEENP